MAFDKKYSTILVSALSTATGLLSNAGTAVGSVIYFTCARLAAVAYGLYKNMARVALQIFPDTCDTGTLDHHGFYAGVDRLAAESDESYLARILAKRRTPAAGGNADDYVTWAKTIAGVSGAACVSTPNGPGSVIVLIWTAEDDPTPSAALLSAVKTYIESVRAAGSGDFSVVAPVLVPTDVTMTAAGTGNASTLKAAIKSYMAGLGPGKTMYVNKLKSLALDAGFDDVSALTTPTANVTSTEYQLIRAGTITVNDD